MSSDLFCFLHVDVQLVQCDLLKRLFFFDGVASHFYQKSIDHVWVNLFLDFLFCSIDLFFYSVTNTTLLYLLQLYIVLKSECRSLNLFFFRIVLAIPLPFHIHFGISLIISTKIGILIGIVLDRQIKICRELTSQ